MKLWQAMPLVLLLSTGARLRADFVSWSFTAQVMVEDDNGHRVPGLQGGTLLNGKIRFNNSAPGIPVSPPNSGLSYPGAGATIDFDVNDVHLGNGAIPVALSIVQYAPSPHFPPPPFAFRMDAFSATSASYLEVGFGMSKHLDPSARLDFSLKNVLLDLSHFDGGYLFYNYNAGGSIPFIGSPSQLLIEAKLVSITPDPGIHSAPEPGSLTLCWLGSIALAGIWWRRRRAGGFR